MTNTLAIVLALILIGIFAADQLFLGLDLHIVLARQMMRLVEWLAFWR